jgi:hypothetical protein
LRPDAIRDFRLPIFQQNFQTFWSATITALPHVFCCLHNRQWLVIAIDRLTIKLYEFFDGQS